MNTIPGAAISRTDLIARAREFGRQPQPYHEATRIENDFFLQTIDAFPGPSLGDIRTSVAQKAAKQTAEINAAASTSLYASAGTLLVFGGVASFIAGLLPVSAALVGPFLIGGLGSAFVGGVLLHKAAMPAEDAVRGLDATTRFGAQLADWGEFLQAQPLAATPQDVPQRRTSAC